MKKSLKKYFIPREENDYKPHFLRGRAVSITALVIVILFFGFLLHVGIIHYSGLTAAILPGVLTDLANQDRASERISPLSINPLLEKAAELKARDMAAKEYFAHISPDGTSPWHWFTQTGYHFIYAGENLAVDFSDSTEVNAAWLNSPTHRANIMNARFTEIGIAAVQGVFNGRSTTFVVQMFGRPAVAPAVPPQSSIRTDAPKPPSPSPATNILGAQTEPTVPEVETLYSDDSLVAVKNRAYEGSSVEETVFPAKESVRYASVAERLFLSPQTVLILLYGIVGAIIFIALVLHIFVEIHRQHPLHILYGILLFLIMGLLIAGSNGASVVRVTVL